MLKKTIVLCFLVLILGPVITYSEEVTLSVDFGITMKDLDGMADSELDRLVEQDTVLILEGSLTSFQTKTSEEDGFSVVLDVINGEWLTDQEVNMYRAEVLYYGERWKPLFPSSRKEMSDISIPLNSHILFLCTLSGYRRDGGKVVPLLQGLKIRVIP